MTFVPAALSFLAMAASRISVDEQVRRVVELRSAPDSTTLRDGLRHALATKTSLVVAKAADVTRERGVHELIPDLVAAFDRFIAAPGSDKGCHATLAIVKALHELDADEASVYLTALRHVQMEAVWGGRTDAATALRAAGAIALARLPRSDVLYHLLPLLVDPSHIVRAAAAQAISACGRSEGALLLRLKVLSGDDEPEVIVECFTSLLQLERDAALAFVGPYLNSEDDALVEAAAIALGTSRLPKAFDLLHQRLTPPRDEPALPALLLALATLRTDQATSFLISIVQDAPVSIARAALDALKLHRSNPPIVQQITDVIQARNDPRLRQAFSERFE